jgi:hypothetical protein
MSRARSLALIAVLAALAAGLIACGGDDDGAGSAQDVVDQTFSGDHENITSGRFDVEFDAAAPKGDFNATLGGPFQGEGKGFPRFDVEAHLTGTGEGGLDFRGGMISTGDRGFVNYKGTDYEIDPAIFSLFTAYFDNLQSESGSGGRSLTQQLGFDPKSWLTNLEDEGEADVEGTQTDHVSGEVDLDRVTADLRSLADKLDSQLGALGGIGGSHIPDPSDLGDLSKLAESATFDLYSGSDDHIVRRFDVSVELRSSGPGDPQTVELGVRLSDVNEEQKIEAPSGARPLNDLLDRLGISDDLKGLGGLGGLDLGGGGEGSGGGSGGGGGGSGGSGGGSFDDYTRCLRGAASPADIDRCNALL